MDARPGLEIGPGGRPLMTYVLYGVDSRRSFLVRFPVKLFMPYITVGSLSIRIPFLSLFKKTLAKLVCIRIKKSLKAWTGDPVFFNNTRFMGKGNKAVLISKATLIQDITDLLYRETFRNSNSVGYDNAFG